jgi:AbrB family looped-hinge helix DNA binding protein
MSEATKAKLTTKCQVTIPQAVRERMGLKPGDEIEFVENDGTFTVRRVFNPAGLLKYRGHLKHLADRTTDEMMEEMRGH